MPQKKESWLFVHDFYLPRASGQSIISNAASPMSAFESIKTERKEFPAGLFWFEFDKNVTSTESRRFLMGNGEVVFCCLFDQFEFDTG